MSTLHHASAAGYVIVPPELDEILDDDEFWAESTHEPTDEDWAAIRALEGDRDPEDSPCLAAHTDQLELQADHGETFDVPFVRDRYHDESPAVAPWENFAPWYDFVAPDFWADRRHLEVPV